MRAIVVHEPGGPDTLRFEEVETPEPGAGEVLVKVEAAWVNYAEAHHAVEGRTTTGKVMLFT